MIKDIRGKEFNTEKDMCDHWNLSYSTYQDRKYNGWSLRDRLLGRSARHGRNKKVEDLTDPNGRVWNNQKEMSEAWNVKYETFCGRRRRGMSVSEALTYQHPTSTVSESERTDHTGKVFDSKKAMFDFWNTDQASVDQAIKNGHTLEEALTGMFSSRWGSDIESRTDHTGRVFETERAMCKFWGITHGTYYHRIHDSKMTKEQALTLPTKRIGVEAFGKKFKNEKEACEHFNISYNTYRTCRKKGSSVEEALKGIGIEDEVKAYGLPKEQRTDHLGIVYDTRKEMCETYGVDSEVFKSRIEAGWTLEEALGVEDRINIGQVVIELKVEKLIYVANGARFFMCTINDEREVLSDKEIKSYGR